MNSRETITAAFAARLGRFDLDAAFTVPASGVTALFGPSGSGKTTVLRCMAGLHRLDGGRCVVAGDVWQDEASFRPVHRRPIGYVFQEASLFPHLSVTANLLYATRGRKPDPASADVAFDEVVALLGLGKLLERAPDTLSGGERQRVAIGRALLSQPKLLLMDEPLSALDSRSKEEILPFLERLRDTLALPVVYVSHAMTEVERLADHIVLMESGRVIGSGPLAQVQSDPALPLFRARDAVVTLEAAVEACDEAYGLAVMAVDGGRFTVPMPGAAIGDRRRLTIAAGDVSLARRNPSETTVLNILPARIVSAKQSSAYEIVAILSLGPDGEGARLLARVTRRSWERLGLAEGMPVFAQVKSVALAAPES